MLKEILIQKKSSILSNWIELIFDSYADETSKFLKTQKNQFSNPVGYTISFNAERIFDELVSNQNLEDIKSYLEEIIKIRAIQEYTPSQAVSFVLDLKRIVRLKLNADIDNPEIRIELGNFELILDNIILLAFDIYQSCREKLYQIRVNEIKANSTNN
jgi:hypothetical protein